MSFESLGLRAELLRAVQEHGYSVPTAVQAFAIPQILAGRDVLVSAQTGSGKTAGFTLPLLQLLMPAAGATVSAADSDAEPQQIDDMPQLAESSSPAMTAPSAEPPRADTQPEIATEAQAQAAELPLQPLLHPVFGARSAVPTVEQPVTPSFPSFGRVRTDVASSPEVTQAHDEKAQHALVPGSAERAGAANLASGPSGTARARSAPPPQALILVPTRELCAQVTESVRAYGRYLPLRCVQIFGGVGMQPQVVALKAGVDIIVATPGRLLDHIQRGSVDLSALKVLVLDEADRMLDMGFVDVIKRVIDVLPARRQNLMFSASPSGHVVALADELLVQSEVLKLVAKTRPIAAIEQLFYDVEPPHKADALAFLFHERGWPQALIFTRTKHGADRLAKKLYRAGITSDSIHGNKGQGARMRALSRFKSAEIAALVATDVAARGIDIEGLPLVVNFDLPHVPEDFLQRVGRTGTEALLGQAISLVSMEEQQQLIKL